MFFRKDIFNTKPAALEPEAETAEDEVRNPPPTRARSMSSATMPLPAIWPPN